MVVVIFDTSCSIFFDPPRHNTPLALLFFARGSSFQGLPPLAQATLSPHQFDLLFPRFVLPSKAASPRPDCDLAAIF
jgi:hypothetical protein